MVFFMWYSAAGNCLTAVHMKIHIIKSIVMLKKIPFSCRRATSVQLDNVLLSLNF